MRESFVSYMIFLAGVLVGMGLFVLLAYNEPGAPVQFIYEAF